MSQTQEKPRPEADPLASLHKMSTTAGLGSTEYVAVNPTAIFALALGVASFVTLFNEPLLLLIPLAGIVTAIIALRQIARSNGTQTGRALAVGAILLSLGFGGMVAGKTVMQTARERRDKAEIEALVQVFSKKLLAGDYQGLHGLFDRRFQERVPPGAFVDQMKFIQNTDVYGKVKAVTWTGLAEYVDDEATNSRLATAHLLWQFDKNEEVRQQAWFRKENGKWVFDDIPGLFPKPRSPGEGPPGGR